MAKTFIEFPCLPLLVVFPDLPSPTIGREQTDKRNLKQIINIVRILGRKAITTLHEQLKFGIYDDFLFDLEGRRSFIHKGLPERPIPYGFEGLDSIEHLQLI